jgi:hypothetical protein
MKKIILLIVFGSILLGCGTLKNAKVIEEKIPASGLRAYTDGIPVYNAVDLNYKRKEGEPLHIRFDDPVTVAVASKPEKWGYFQFPNIRRKADGSIQVKWNMTMDAIEAYGIEDSGSANSVDGGKTWTIKGQAETAGGILLPNGDRLEIITPKPIKVGELKLPEPVGKGIENYRKSGFTFYRLHDLPENRQGVYLKRLKKGETVWKEEHASLYDPDAARYSLSGLVPVVWWGDVRVAADGSLIAGIYPGFLIGKDGLTDPKSAVFFYRSTDGGHSWRIQGRISYQADPNADPQADKRSGFSEPSFEILKDGTFLCVMRTTDGVGNGPMYASYSKDMGKTWTRPDAITAAGVLPKLLQLDNGVVVMASGRPGVQLRFSTNGKLWSDAFEMLPFTTDLASEMTWKGAVSCGYTELLATGADRFLIVFSDFKYKTAQGEIRKAIKVREITVNPR